MSARDERPPGGKGGWTGASGTPVAVDLSGDRLARTTWAVFLAGPVIWFTHFMVVYLVAEAGCTGDGPGLDAFDPPVPAAATLIATGVAALACLSAARWAYRRGHGAQPAVPADEADGRSGPFAERDHRDPRAFAGFLLSSFSFLAVLFVGLPALVFQC